MIKSRKKIIFLSIIIIATITTLGLYFFTGDINKFSNRIPGIKRTQFKEPPKNWRNLRYAEIVPVFRNGGKFYVEVYNSVYFNELPEDLWKKLNAEVMAKKYDAMKVILNGPRYWLINEMKTKGESQDGKVANFGGIEMRLVAVIKSSIFKGSVGSKFYKENEVNRETVYTFWKNHRVYELTSPKGDVYRMQSYCQIKDSSLSIDKLQDLGKKLELPKGWSYSSKVLTHNETMVANGVAYVINDNLGNSYQKMNP
jgi:hypothetical protein